MNADEPDDELVDQVVDRVMRGERVDLDALLAGRPDVSPATRARLEKLAGVFGRSGATPGTAPDAPTLPFERIGPYRLLRRLGEGGMGTVYLAEHEFLARRVALKLVRPELALSPVVRERFHREAMSVAKLRHANIVAVHDAREEGGVTYIVMELVEGQGLDELVAQAAARDAHLPLEDSVRWARDIARALECAHAAGIVHRDVKPSNVRITPDGRALLLDFGLASVSALAALSRSGFFHGTPHYASPEQVAAERTEIEARTDLYSLGVTLYECLTGSLPYFGETPQQLFHQILVKAPAPPHTKNPEVDERLEGIVLKCLAKRREDRYATAGELAEALDRWLAAARPPAGPAATPAGSRPDRRTASRWKRRGALGAGIATVALAIWIAQSASRATDGTASRTPAVPGADRVPSEPPALRTRRLLFGSADVPFDQRLAAWGEVAGNGTFGADFDGPGVTGTCHEAMSGKPFPLEGRAGRVRGRFEPLPVLRSGSAPETPTERIGFCLEHSDSRGYGVLLSRTAEGYRARMHELLHDGRGGWSPLADLGDALDGNFGDGRDLWIEATWWQDSLRLGIGPDAPANRVQHAVPLAGGGDAPRRLWLLVEGGSARFTDFVLEGP